MPKLLDSQPYSITLKGVIRLGREDEMACSQRVRIKDVRGIYRLLGECRELGRDPDAWQRHMFIGLCRLVRAQVGIGGPATLNRGVPVPDFANARDTGWTDARARTRYLEFAGSDEAGREVTLAAISRLNQPPRPLITRRRAQFVDDVEWYGSVSFNEYRRPAGLDHHVLSVAALPLSDRGEAQVHGITLHRALGDPPFGTREVRMVRLFHHELRPMLGRELLLARRPINPPTLPPRLRQVLAGLLEGDSEKIIARRLGLSPHTVHEHVKRLHRRFNVQSRAELLACCLRSSNRD